MNAQAAESAHMKIVWTALATLSLSPQESELLSKLLEAAYFAGKLDNIQETLASITSIRAVER